MEKSSRHDTVTYRASIAHGTGRAVSDDDARARFAHRIDVESNSYHGAAIRKAEQDRLDRLYPRLHR